MEGGESNGVCGREQCCTVAANIGKHLAFGKSVLQRLWRCGGSGGVRIEWGMW